MNDDIDDDENSTALPDGESVQINSEADSFRETGEGGLYSEVFWANAVNTTISQTHPRVPQLTTKLECQYKFENGLLYVRTLRYKMTTRGQNQNRANIDLYLRALGSAEKISPDSLLQDGEWHAYDHVISAPYGPTASGGLKNRMYIRVDYDGPNNDVEPHEGYSADVYPVSTPIIQSPASGALVSQPFLVTGSHGLFGGVISARFFKNGIAQIIGSGIVKNDGSWEVSAHLPPNDLRVTMFVEQHNGAQKSRISNSVVVSRYRAPRITYPANGVVLLLGTALKLKGDGTYGKIIDVYTPGGGIHHGSGTAGVNQDWETNFNIANYPLGGLVQMVAGHRGVNDWSLLHSFTLLGKPIIEVPAAGAVTDPRGPLSGTGEPGATVDVYKDLSHTIRIGQAQVQSNKYWEIETFENEMTPGPFSIVARQTLSGLPTDFGAPRGFKVRPARFVNVNVEIIDTSIKFSGTAHPGATVEITGPAGTVPPPPVTADTGPWSTTATGWPYGTYTAQIIQKVGDGASGWIVSLPFEFTVENKLPEVSELAFTPDYQPTFSGKGNARATVRLWENRRDEDVAPDVPVTTSGLWSSTALEIWGPTFKRLVRIRQVGDGQDSGWVFYEVSIPPLAPGLNPPVEEGFSPRLSGTCWPGAKVNIQFSDEDGIVHEGNVVDGTWTFRREKEFALGEHTVTVTQFAAEQNSAAVCATFSINRSMQRPIIIQPDPQGVGRDVTIFGTNGMQDATMQLRDAQFQTLLGPAKTLDTDGAWSIDLTGLKYRRYTIDAQQTLNANPSERSESRQFEVVLLPPEIDQPTSGGKLPRTAKINGRGMANGRVEVFLEGVVEPLLTNLPVSGEGRWEGEVMLPLVGRKTIWARQTFVDENGETQKSDDTLPLHFDVVPAPPIIETPLEQEQVGREAVVSGFGVPGDTVTVALDPDRQSSIVLEDRTWSVRLTGASMSGFRVLEATAMCDDFESEPARRTVEQCTYQPVIEQPAAGHRLSDPVPFSGQGREGSVRVVSWYSPDVTWGRELTVTDGAWRGESQVPLPVGGNWCRVGQTLIDEPSGVTGSDWVQSSRFEVVPVLSTETEPLKNRQAVINTVRSDSRR